jgi:hypothetical protein
MAIGRQAMDANFGFIPIPGLGVLAAIMANATP